MTHASLPRSSAAALTTHLADQLGAPSHHRAEDVRTARLPTLRYEGHADLSGDDELDESQDFSDDDELEDTPNDNDNDEWPDHLIRYTDGLPYQGGTWVSMSGEEWLDGEPFQKLLAERTARSDSPGSTSSDAASSLAAVSSSRADNTTAGRPGKQPKHVRFENEETRSRRTRSWKRLAIALKTRFTSAHPQPATRR